MAHKSKAKPRQPSVPPPSQLQPADADRPEFLADLPLTRVAAGLALLHLVLAAMLFDPTIFTGGDNGVYVALSQSILSLHDYISIHDPVPSGHTYYPPGYPVILAMAALVGIKPWVHIKLLTVGFSVAGVVFSYLWLRRRTTPAIALAAAAITAISPGLLANSHYELSDVPFWALITCGLWLLESVPKEARLRVALAALATAAAYLTRTAALPIVVAAIAWLLLEKRWRQTATFAVIVFPAMAAWYWWTSTYAANNDYGNQFWYLEVYAPELGRASALQLLARIPANIEAYGNVMMPLFLRGESGPFILGLGVLGLALVGWALRLRRFGLSELVFPCYGGMLFLCPPPWAGERYMLPIVPLALAYMFEAVAWPIRNLRPVYTVSAGVAGLLLFVALAFESIPARAAQAAMCRATHRAGYPYECLAPQWQDYLSIADWAATGLPSDAIVISRKPGLFFALSGKRGTDIPKTERPAEFFRIAREHNASYLVLDRVDYLTSFYTVPVVAQYVGSFCLIRPGTTEGTAVVGIHLDRPMTPTPSGSPPNLVPCPASFGATGGS